MNFNSTVKGSLLEGFYPAGWDFARIDACCANAPETITERQSFWHKDFTAMSFPIDRVCLWIAGVIAVVALVDYTLAALKTLRELKARKTA
mgnify:CR=1 FL=1